MTAQSGYLRPIGFRPWEIAALQNQEVIDQHAEEAAFLWLQRDHAVRAPQYALKDLAKLDERVEAHVDGLRVAGAAGWDTCMRQLEEGAGEVFAAAVLAFESDEEARISRVVRVGCAKPTLERGVISALGWVSEEVATQEGPKLLACPEKDVRRAGLAGMAIRRMDPGMALTRAIADENVRLAARALRAAGELGRVDLIPQIISRLDDLEEECRFWSAWAATRLGMRTADVIRTLQTTTETMQTQAEQAADLSFRMMNPDDAQEWQARLAGDDQLARFGVIGAGALGDPASIPWLIAQMEVPELARVAGAAFSMISGADLAYDDLDREAPAELSDDEPALSDADMDLRWPDPARVTQWWVKRSAMFVPGVRYLLGTPMTEDTLRMALARGKQNQRMAAAIELGLRYPQESLFETRARGESQLQTVKQWNS